MGHCHLNFSFAQLSFADSPDSYSADSSQLKMLCRISNKSLFEQTDAPIHCNAPAFCILQISRSSHIGRTIFFLFMKQLLFCEIIALIESSYEKPSWYFQPHTTFNFTTQPTAVASLRQKVKYARTRSQPEQHDWLKEEVDGKSVSAAIFSISIASPHMVGSQIPFLSGWGLKSWPGRRIGLLEI